MTSRTNEISGFQTERMQVLRPAQPIEDPLYADLPVSQDKEVYTINLIQVR